MELVNFHIRGCYSLIDNNESQNHSFFMYIPDSNWDQLPIGFNWFQLEFVSLSLYFPVGQLANWFQLGIFNWEFSIGTQLDFRPGTLI